MKPLFLTLVLSLSLAGFGQEVYYPTGKIDTALLNKVDSVSDEWRKEFLWRDSLKSIRDSVAPIYDTIPVVMLVSDTTPVNQEYWKSLGNGLIQKETVSIVSSEMWQMVGYEVTELVPLTPMFTPLAGADAMIYNPNATYTTKTITYLDHAKKPLNLCVWETKERREK